MRIVTFVEDEILIKQILKDLNLWMIPNKDPPSKELSKEEILLLQKYNNEDNKFIKEYIQSETSDYIPKYEDFTDYIPDYDECS